MLNVFNSQFYIQFYTYENLQILVTMRDFDVINNLLRTVNSNT